MSRTPSKGQGPAAARASGATRADHVIFTTYDGLRSHMLICWCASQAGGTTLS